MKILIRKFEGIWERDRAPYAFPAPAPNGARERRHPFRVSRLDSRHVMVERCAPGSSHDLQSAATQVSPQCAAPTLASRLRATCVPRKRHTPRLTQNRSACRGTLTAPSRESHPGSMPFAPGLAFALWFLSRLRRSGRNDNCNRSHPSRLREGWGTRKCWGNGGSRGVRQPE